MTDILQLPGWTVTKTRSEDRDFIIEADYSEPATACQKCGVVGKLYRHGTKAVRFRDSPIRGAPVWLEGTVQRYRCRECGETFMPILKGVETDRRMTKRCVEYIQEQCLRDTFTRIAEHVGCVEGTVRNIAGERIERLDGEFKPYLPEWLGIDETKLDRAMRCILTDVGNNKPIDILHDRDKRTLAVWLQRFPDRSKVKGVAIDMWKPYKDVAATMFGKVPVVIDKFHVVRMANSAIERVRIRVQRDKTKATRIEWKRSRIQLVKRAKNLNDKQRLNLDIWLANEPEIAEAYRLKEAFFDLYELPKDDAIRAFDEFPKTVPASMKADWTELTRAMKNWRTEILAYFDHPISNGYTEALNGVAKVINRAGRGYSFEVMRARILWREQANQPRPKLLVSEVFKGGSIAEQMRERERVYLLHAGRCKSCSGSYDIDDIAVVNGEPICRRCYERFHTEGVTHDDSLST